MCLSLFPGEALTEEAELQLPENVIDGSARATISVLGKLFTVASTKQLLEGKLVPFLLKHYCKE